tara:strand:- start:255 stop:611 length:357 start_codon:yes stop_codon:yes gene_type:complete
MNKSYAMAVRTSPVVKASQPCALSSETEPEPFVLKADTTKPPIGFSEKKPPAGFKKILLISSNNSYQQEKILKMLKNFLTNQNRNQHCTIMERRMQHLLKSFITLLVDYDDMINLKKT